MALLSFYQLYLHVKSEHAIAIFEGLRFLFYI